MKLPPALSASVLLTTAVISGCGQPPAGQPNQTVRQDRLQEGTTQRANELKYDEELMTKRGYRQVDLSFDLTNVPATGAAKPSPASSRLRGSLGVFRLGMTLGDARLSARQAGLYSTGQFTWTGQMEDGWCAPPASGRNSGSVLAPKQLNFAGMAGAGKMASYSLELIPSGGRLTVGSIQLSVGDKLRRMGPDILRDARNAGNVAPYGPCELTSDEKRLLHGWDRTEELALRNSLGPAQLGFTDLPSRVRGALHRWERSVAVECDGSADCYSVSADFDGYWQSDGRFVVSYTVGVGGEASHLVAFMIVLDAEGKILWHGQPAEFAERGLQGHQQTIQQAEGGP